MSAWAAAAAAAAGALGHTGARRNMKTGMAWEQRQRETKYQTMMGDMKRAGLNPILAGQLGAGGNLSAPSASGGPDMGGVAPAINQSESIANQKRVQDEQIDLIKANSRKARAEAEQIEKSGPGVLGRGINTGFRMFEHFQEWLKASKTTTGKGKNTVVPPVKRYKKGPKKDQRIPGQLRRDINKFRGKSGKTYKGEKALRQM